MRTNIFVSTGSRRCVFFFFFFSNMFNETKIVFIYTRTDLRTIIYTGSRGSVTLMFSSVQSRYIRVDFGINEPCLFHLRRSVFDMIMTEEIYRVRVRITN
jgi:hypothetical protein